MINVLRINCGLLPDELTGTPTVAPPRGHILLPISTVCLFMIKEDSNVLIIN